MVKLQHDHKIDQILDVNTNYKNLGKHIVKVSQVKGKRAM